MNDNDCDNDDVKFTPRHLKTIYTEVGSAVQLAYEIWLELFEDKEKAEESFWGLVRAVFEDDDSDGDKETEIEKLIECQNSGTLIFQLIHAILCYSMQAIKTPDEKEGLSWSYVADMQYWVGITNANYIKGLERLEEEGQEVTNAAAMMANKRHEEHRDMAEFVRKYWKENIDRNLSAQKAATEMVRKNVVNFSHKKLAEIISKAKKGES